MERLGQLEPRISVLEDDFDEDKLEAEAGNAAAAAVCAPFTTHSSPSRDARRALNESMLMQKSSRCKAWQLQMSESWPGCMCNGGHDMYTQLSGWGAHGLIQGCCGCLTI